MTWRNWPIRSPQWWLVVVCTAFPVALIVWAGMSGTMSTVERSVVIGASAIALIFLWIHHNWLTVDDRQLRIGYFPLWRISIPLDAVAGVTVESVRPIPQFGGLGMKGHPRSGAGMLLGGSPQSAVVIETTDARRFVCTFAQADAIAAELRRRAVYTGTRHVHDR